MLVPGLWGFTVLPALPCLVQVSVSVLLKPHVMSCVWSQPDLRLGGEASCLLRNKSYLLRAMGKEQIQHGWMGVGLLQQSEGTQEGHTPLGGTRGPLPGVVG